jgi:putative nucleotidyltransferase with HDIG domain
MTNDGATTALDVLERTAPRAWLVGGAVRDRLLGRPTLDYDVAVDGDVPRVARHVAGAVGAWAFELSHGFGAWRVVPRAPIAGRGWQLDLLPLLHGSIEADLGQRDLTINALAQPLGHEELVDPFGGVGDLESRRLRMVSAEAFERDPLRTLRLARLACETGFQVEPRTAAQARASAPGLQRVSAERIFEELKRILCAPDPVRGLELMDQLAITAVVIPELAELRGVEQSRYHHLDVHAHTLAVLSELVEIDRSPERYLGACAAEADRFLSAVLANGLTRWQALRFAALLHDIAKPQTRRVTAEGRVTFMGHDTAGARATGEILTRLRASARLRDHVAALAHNHLRLGFLVHERPLSRRAVYRYLQETDPVGVDVTVLSVADRLATRGDRSEEAIAAHVGLADQLLCEALEWVRDPPRPPLRGDELAAALGIAPGPELGGILEELREAAFAGEVSTRQEAIDHARRQVAGQPGAGRDR